MNIAKLGLNVAWVKGHVANECLLDVIKVCF